MSVTHRRISTIASFLAFDNGTMDVGYHVMSVGDIMVNLGDDGMGFHEVVTNVANGSTGASRHRRRRFSRCTASKRQILDPFLVEIPDLA